MSDTATAVLMVWLVISAALLGYLAGYRHAIEDTSNKCRVVTSEHEKQK